ncbi:class IV adenylate cyclase [Candidatus Pacearchaeota archaeon CG10_big_fil_rev_8_21_14_0_10_34_76]|nr:MAG: class IV adenylate cyclase [Candidatus Pacearchaeota archaeon CG10_big_fil_rev_8_21_14_0_10_34_76]
MNEEVEIKVALLNRDVLEIKLNEIAQLLKEKVQKDEYFTPRHEDFFDLDPPVEYLRIRNENGKNELHYNFLHLDENKLLLKTDEYETSVGDPEMMKTILEKLDMVNKVTVTKKRKTYTYDNFEICLDFIEELGDFIEVEAKKIIGSVEGTREKCYEILREIGAEFKEIPLKFRGYPLMVLAKEAGKFKI